MALPEVLPTPRSLLRTSSQHQRGVLSGNPEAGWGRVPFFTHLSHVSGEIQSSPEPVARSTNSGTRSRGRKSCLHIVTRRGPPRQQDFRKVSSLPPDRPPTARRPG